MRRWGNWGSLMRRFIGFGLVMLAMAGCATTEEANKAMQSRWVGQPSDAFFAAYGPPIRSFPLNNGGAVYSWRGGETTRVIPAQYQTVQPAAPAAPLASNTQTTTTVSNPNPNTTVTRTTTSSMSIGLPTVQPQQVMVRPERVESLLCEAQITVDAGGVITNIQASRDTTGAGLSLSRCAEVFGVE